MWDGASGRCAYWIALKNIGKVLPLRESHGVACRLRALLTVLGELSLHVADSRAAHQRHEPPNYLLGSRRVTPFCSLSCRRVLARSSRRCFFGVLLSDALHEAFRRGFSLSAPLAVQGFGESLKVPRFDHQ